MPLNYNLYGKAAQADDAAIVDALLPSMFSFDASAQPSLNRDYVVSAVVTASSPNQVVTYEINPKAAWDSGQPVSEKDFEGQWRALGGSNAAYLSGFTQGYDRISSVTQGKDTREVLVTFRQPYADWRGLFSPLYPASLTRTPEAFNTGWITGTPTSAGPFMFKGLDAGAKTVTLVRDPKWWGRPAKLDSIVFHAIGSDPTTQLDALRQGQIDFAGIAPDLSQLNKGRAIRDTSVRLAGGPTFRQITFNAKSPTLQDTAVRTAIALGIDRAAITKAMLGPLGAPDVTLNNHIFMENQRGYQNNAGEFTTVDTAKAASMLSQAGWVLAGSGAGAARSKGGQALSIRLVIPEGIPEAAQEAGLVKTQLTALGVQLLVQPVPTSQLVSNYLSTGDFDLALFSWQGTLFPISSNLPIYISPTKRSDGSLDWHQNYARVTSTDLDKLLIQASAELDSQKVITLGNQIDAAIWGEIHSLTLYQRPQIVIAKQNLANFGAFGFATTNYEDIGFTK